ncbi:MAG TPA: hypothetical protein VK963_04090 [Candidatus Saccharimonadales bacterium]|nr:hypothetical protein [Candidatus Saccharimonadales bacterium]
MLVIDGLMAPQPVRRPGFMRRSVKVLTMALVLAAVLAGLIALVPLAQSRLG